MSIAVTCPNCRKKYKVDDRHAGRTFKCKVCQGIIAVQTEVPDIDSLMTVSDSVVAMAERPSPVRMPTPIGRTVSAIASTFGSTRSWRRQPTSVLMTVGILIALGIGYLLPWAGLVFGILSIIGGIILLIIALGLTIGSTFDNRSKIRVPIRYYFRAESLIAIPLTFLLLGFAKSSQARSKVIFGLGCLPLAILFFYEFTVNQRSSTQFMQANNIAMMSARSVQQRREIEEWQQQRQSAHQAATVPRAMYPRAVSPTSNTEPTPNASGSKDSGDESGPVPMVVPKSANAVNHPPVRTDGVSLETVPLSAAGGPATIPPPIRAASQPAANSVPAVRVAVGDHVEVFWGNSWWPASVLKREGRKTFIHYDNNSDTWNEWVTADRIRRLKP